MTHSSSLFHYFSCLFQLLHNKANINAVNEHGNTPLHYASFWNHDEIAENLVNNGAIVAMANKFGETPLDKAKPNIRKILKGSVTFFLFIPVFLNKQVYKHNQLKSTYLNKMYLYINALTKESN